MYLSILYNSKTQNIIIRVDNTVPAIVMESHARLALGRWTHISVVHRAPPTDKPGNGEISLFFNGVLDTVKEFTGHGGWGNPLPLYLGSLPWSTSYQCSLTVLLDDLKIWARPVSYLEIAADSFPSLGMIETTYTKLGCDFESCTCSQSYEACQKLSANPLLSHHLKYHLCNKNELNAGAYQVGRTMRWIDWDTKIWIAKEGGGCEGTDEQEMRLALCCKS